MNVTDPSEAQTARRPMSDTEVSVTGPCEGQQAAPSNPTGGGKPPSKVLLTANLAFRCTANEKAELRAKAIASGLPISTLLREALGLVKARRRKPVPSANPELVLALGRIGGNLNQLARWLNHAMKVRRTDLDILVVARCLIEIERQLSQILEETGKC